jgi:hypothetical protein
MPGTFVHVVELVVAGAVTLAQSRHDARVPGTDAERVIPYAMPIGRSRAIARPTPIHVRQCFCISILLCSIDARL